MRNSFKNNKIIGMGLDVLDSEALRRVLAKHDAVLNLTGPFFKFAYPILEAALKENCHYLDICDDWEPTEKMFTLNELAQEKNKTAIIGLGASPGITNFLALKAMTELDFEVPSFTFLFNIALIRNISSLTLKGFVT